MNFFVFIDAWCTTSAKKLSEPKIVPKAHKKKAKKVFTLK